MPPRPGLRIGPEGHQSAGKKRRLVGFGFLVQREQPTGAPDVLDKHPRQFRAPQRVYGIPCWLSPRIALFP